MRNTFDHRILYGQMDDGRRSGGREHLLKSVFMIIKFVSFSPGVADISATREVEATTNVYLGTQDGEVTQTA